MSWRAGICALVVLAGLDGAWAQSAGPLDTPGPPAQIKVFRILNGDASHMLRMLTPLVPARSREGQAPAAAGGEPSLVSLRFSVDERTNCLIAVGSPEDLRIIGALITRLDADEFRSLQTGVYRLKNSPAIDMASSINNLLRTYRQAQPAPGAFNPFQQIEAEVVVVPEPVSNSLILNATPRFFKMVADLIKQLDAQPFQVMIQVLIAEVTLSKGHEFGIEAGLQDSVLFDRSLLAGNLTTLTRTNQLSTPAGIITSTEQTTPAASLTPGFAFNNQPLGNATSAEALGGANHVGTQGLTSFSLGRVNNELGYGGLVLSASSEAVSLLVRALENSQRLEVLSRPQVMTLENQPAFIQIGKRVPRITGTTILSGSVSTIALENVGLLLGVTPRVSPEGMVVMEIDAERSEVAPEAEGIPVSFVNGYVLRSPNINTTLAQTTVSAADGQTIVLGGLITKSSSATDRGVPWLSDIPVVGNLFSYRARTERRTELLIILTPHVVRSPEEVDRVKRIESSRMTWCLGNVRKVHGDGGLSSNSAVPERIYPDVMPRGTPPAGPALDIYNDPLLQGAPAPPPPPASQTPADVPQGGDR